jgi:hypothetical protein
MPSASQRSAALESSRVWLSHSRNARVGTPSRVRSVGRPSSSRNPQPAGFAVIRHAYGDHARMDLKSGQGGSFYPKSGQGTHLRNHRSVPSPTPG